MSEKLDIVGIGNAMVDAIIPSNKEEVEKNKLNRDSMNLIDEDLKNSLHQNYSIKEMAGGRLSRKFDVWYNFFWWERKLYRKNKK